MTWNYRVVHHRRPNVLPDGRVIPDEPPMVDAYEIHEVYYDGAGRVTNMTVDAMPVVADTVDGLRWVLDRMREALDKPVLTYDVEMIHSRRETNDHDVA